MMEREIKFRGKTKDSKWVNSGISFAADGTAFIVNTGEDHIGHITHMKKVDKRTIGQYTGLKDKNGVEIYEGDIVKASYGYGQNGGDVVEFNLFVYAMLDGLVDEDSIEVIGNKYDNPELIVE